MRFVLGVVIGLGIGFAGAVLFAPEKKKERPEFPKRVINQATGATGANGHKSFIDQVRTRLDEAMSEANQARKQAEREMTERYERSVGRRK